MPLEREKAELLTGYHFVVHPHNPSVGVLRLDTKGKPRWLLVDRKGLLSLAEACTKHAKELQQVQ